MAKFVLDTIAFEEALKFSRGKYTFQVSSDLTESLIRTIHEKLSRLEYGEALRFSLNELHIFSKNNKKREAYKSAVSKYFNRHSHKVRKANIRYKRPKVEKPKRKPPVEKIIEKDGQYAFKV